MEALISWVLGSKVGLMVLGLVGTAAAYFGRDIMAKIQVSREKNKRIAAECKVESERMYKESYARDAAAAHSKAKTLEKIMGQKEKQHDKEAEIDDTEGEDLNRALDGAFDDFGGGGGDDRRVSGDGAGGSDPGKDGD